MSDNLDNNPEFQEYRKKMHADLSGTRGDDDFTPRRRFSPLQIAFGIFMIIVYVGMGVLLFINFFGMPDTAAWNIGRWIVGVVLVIYGIFRGYRMFTGIDS